MAKYLSVTIETNNNKQKIEKKHLNKPCKYSFKYTITSILNLQQLNIYMNIVGSVKHNATVKITQQQMSYLFHGGDGWSVITYTYHQFWRSKYFVLYIYASAVCVCINLKIQNLSNCLVKFWNSRSKQIDTTLQQVQ